jgi:alpha-D-ribose 1-methylphosphonate 5-triphosphate synthase subunit PhnH
MSAAPPLGLPDRVHDAQASFRAVLEALARPGRAETVGRPIAGLPLGPAMAYALLSLTDEDTPVWWQQPDAQLAHWLRFHTGARSTVHAGEAAFAVVTDPAALPALETFAAGSAASPEFSTTVLVEVPNLRDGPMVQGRGPGIRTSAELRIAGLPGRFWAQWQANHARFPLGVDLLFTCGDRLLGLPRTVRVRRLQEVA